MLPEYEIIDIGIHHPDYFQGFGIDFYHFSIYGIGCDPAGALDDCLDQMAAHGPITEPIDFDELKTKILTDFPDFADPSVWPNVPIDTYYYIGIRWNE